MPTWTTYWILAELQSKTLFQKNREKEREAGREGGCKEGKKKGRKEGKKEGMKERKKGRKEAVRQGFQKAVWLSPCKLQFHWFALGSGIVLMPV